MVHLEENVSIRVQLAKILGGDLGPDLLHCAGQERDRGGANQPQAAPGLHRGGSLNHHVSSQSSVKGLKIAPKMGLILSLDWKYPINLL